MADQTSPARGSDGASTLDMYIGGEWVQSVEGGVRDAINPATGEVIARVPEGTRADVGRAVEAARDAQPELEFASAFDRADIVEELGDAIERELESLARTLTRDQGKPLDEARAELELVVEMYHNAAAEVKHDETPSLQSEHASDHMFTLRKPHGVLGVITPWNFPTTIPSEYVAPGLAVGNSVVWVPAPTTSVIAVELVEVLADTDLPDGALNLVIGEGPVVGNEVVTHDGVDAIGFTGSPETGDRIARDAGAKPTLLELGGNGPVIVMDDADVEEAARHAATGCFANAGQICTASERILVHEAVAEEFTEKVVDYAEGLSVGDPTDPATDMGPLNNEEVATKMDDHVADAVDRGAAVRHGGDRADGRGSDLYYEPTVLEGVPADATTNEEETFGPIAPITTFADREEALRLGNGIDLGLSSGVFTKNVDTMYYFAERLETGLVNINKGSANWEIHTPVGGYSGKRSGTGRIGGRFTIDELSQLKNVIVHTDN